MNTHGLGPIARMFLPASASVIADPPGRVWGVRHPQGWGLGAERVSVHVTGHPFESRARALAERDACNTDCEYCDRGLHTLVYRDTAPWEDE